MAGTPTTVGSSGRFFAWLTGGSGAQNVLHAFVPTSSAGVELGTVGNPLVTSGGGGGSGGPTGYVAITPNDGTLLTGYQFLRIGAAGNLSIKPTVGGVAVVIAVTAGEYFPFGSGVVMATNTTATSIVAIG